jgi:predicted nucleotidyltransferase
MCGTRTSHTCPIHRNVICIINNLRGEEMHYERLLQQLVEALKQVQGLKAIVLGGSYANSSPRPDSDIDIGLYYNENQLLDIEHIRTIASQLNDTPDPVVTDIGGWGTWVNGGAWLTIQGQRVDFLYRDI